MPEEKDSTHPILLQARLRYNVTLVVILYVY